jgi:hypothetical protein
MNTTIINKLEYISSDALFEKAPVYCKVSRTGRDLIKKKNITDYIYAKLVDKKWTLSDGKSNKFDKVFFKKSFVETIPEINQEKEIVDDNNIALAPNIIHLEDSEKFKDENNNIIELETRGERKVDSLYFKVKDVMTGFKMDNLLTTIIDKRKDGYIENKHYKYFNYKKVATDQNKTNKIKKELFLTYEGILRVLFASHSPNVKPFIKWATETLFTIQMGTVEQKEDLVGSILGVNAKVIKEVFNADRNTLPCVYLFTLNTVKELRSSMNIDTKYDDNAIVAKFGFTKDLTRRTGEHVNKYSKIQNVNLKLKYYSYVDPQYMSNAETDINDIMMAFKIKLDYYTEDELVIIPKELIKIVERHYELIGKNYMGHISELITKIKELEIKYERQSITHEIELEKVKHQSELSTEKIKHQSENFKHQLELSTEKYEHELLKKDFEIMKLQMQLMK